MKKLLAVMCFLLVPGLAPAGQVNAGHEVFLKHEASNRASEGSTGSDIFFRMAHTCSTAVSDCLPNNLPGNPVVAYVKVFVPSTQAYNRWYFITDMEGAVVGFGATAGAVTGGTNDFAVSFSLPAGQTYHFFAMFQSADGKLTKSHSYTFKVVSGGGGGGGVDLSSLNGTYNGQEYAATRSGTCSGFAIEKTSNWTIATSGSNATLTFPGCVSNLTYVSGDASSGFNLNGTLACQGISGTTSTTNLRKTQNFLAGTITDVFDGCTLRKEFFGAAVP